MGCGSSRGVGHGTRGSLLGTHRHLHHPPSEELIATAEAGDAEAQYKIGYWLMQSHVDTTQPREGVQWLEKAANQGHPSACFELAEAYEQGLGVPVNSIKAAHWYHMSTRKGDSDIE
jgi:TPR repeat protein